MKSALVSTLGMLGVGHSAAAAPIHSLVVHNSLKLCRDEWPGLLEVVVLCGGGWLPSASPDADKLEAAGAEPIKRG